MSLLDTSFLDSEESIADESTAEPSAVEDTEEGAPQEEPIAIKEAETVPEGPDEEAGTGEGDAEEKSEEEPEPEAEPKSEEEELEAYADDPNTPQFARKQIKRAGERIAELKQVAEQQAAELEKVRSDQGFDMAEFKQARETEDDVIKMSSIAAKPEHILEFVDKYAPRQREEFRNYVVWSTLETDDGKPDIDNIQAVVDRLYGDGKKVHAEDLLAAGEALASGRLLREEFEEFSPEESESFKRSRSLEQQKEQELKELKAEKGSLETMVRKRTLAVQSQEMTQAFQSRLDPLLEKFHLNDDAKDPPEARDFKRDIREKIVYNLEKMQSTNPRFVEVQATFDALTEPTLQGLEAAEADVVAVLRNPGFKKTVNSAISDVVKHVEKLVVKEARRYSLMMKGLELENSGVKNARALPKNAEEGRTTRFTAEELSQMDAAKRRHTILKGMSDELRATQEPRSSFG